MATNLRSYLSYETHTAKLNENQSVFNRIGRRAFVLRRYEWRGVHDAPSQHAEYDNNTN